MFLDSDGTRTKNIRNTTKRIFPNKIELLPAELVCILEKDEPLNIDFDSQFNKCPTIDITLNGIKVNALIDSGSEVTAISEKFYNENLDAFKSCATLPLCGKFIKTATGNKSTRLKLQVMISTKLKNFSLYLIYIVVPNLIKDCVIGYDSQKKLKMLFDAGLKEITFTVDDFVDSMPYVDQDLDKNSYASLHIIECNEGDSDHNSLHLKSNHNEGDSDHNSLYSNTDHNDGDSDLISLCSKACIDGDNDLKSLHAKTNHATAGFVDLAFLFSNEGIEQRINESTKISANTKTKLIRLIKNRKLQSLIKTGSSSENYKNSLRVEKYKPIVLKNYLVPKMYRDKVKKKIDNPLNITRKHIRFKYNLVKRRNYRVKMSKTQMKNYVIAVCVQNL